VITHLRQRNPQLKLLGLTATPYRLDKGWIYQQHYHGFVRTEQPVPFSRCIYELPMRQLIRRGFLTTPTVIDAPAARYQFDELPEEYTEAELDQFLSRYPRVTRAICEQLLQLAQGRRGVMVFAASVKHAEEIAHYLPSDCTAVITGATPSAERDRLIEAFKQQALKFLVNVAVLTTGFDAPHVDLIAILRRTASVSLYQQMVGRGLRLFEGKADCLVIDYAGNNYDLHQPEIGERRPHPNSEPVQVICPECSFANIFWGLKDGDGDIIEHYGRRCQGLVDDPEEPSRQIQCSYRYQYKSCPHCNGQNDIAARQCQSCGAQLIDADNLLRQALQLKDRKVLRCAGITATTQGEQLTLIYHDEEGAELTERFDFSRHGQRNLFNQLFCRWRSAKPQTLTSVDAVLAAIPQLVAPDFVIARQHKKYWKIEHRIFDYQGPYRKANQL
jgi:DNA repair protein RadD